MCASSRSVIHRFRWVLLLVLLAMPCMRGASAAVEGGGSRLGVYIGGTRTPQVTVEATIELDLTLFVLGSQAGRYVVIAVTVNHLGENDVQLTTKDALTMRVGDQTYTGYFDPEKISPDLAKKIAATDLGDAIVYSARLKAPKGSGDAGPRPPRPAGVRLYAFFDTGAGISRAPDRFIYRVTAPGNPFELEMRPRGAAAS